MKRANAPTGIIHDYPSAFPYLTLSHMHTDACCGIDEFTGKPSFVCNYEFNACTTCQCMGASAVDMEKCVRFRREKMRKESNDERRLHVRGCF
jgi:hypothetical protein